MKILVVYDSQTENTEQVAQTIARTLGGEAAGTHLIKASDAADSDVVGLDLLVAGSSTQRFTATEDMTQFLESLPSRALSYMKVAAFDTRLRSEMGGTASEKIERILKQKGGIIAAPAGGFYVDGKGGPLSPGELERAAEWAKKLTPTKT